ncbi:MAG: Tol-Pal system protein TolB [Alphaproteobacteria bacterium]|nr:Tol-Pal system protein TolB [Alphaproteobacteria bacterium]
MIAFIIIFTLFSQLHGSFSLSVSQGQVASFSIATLPFSGQSATQTPISDIISNNLRSSSFFDVEKPTCFAQDTLPFPSPPNFHAWKANKTQFVITGATSFRGAQIMIEYNVWDVFAARLIFKGAIKVEQNSWRRAGHIIADRIHKALVGHPACFDTQIAFINETHGHKTLIKQLAIMDQDGGNMRILTPLSSRVMTPCFSPNTNLLAFTSFTHTVPKVYFINLITGEVRFLRSFPGMTYAPRFSPDGRMLIFSGAVGSESNIYTYNLSSEKITRLTKNNLVETSPSFSPDGESIVFTAGTTSQPHLFIMDKNGKNRTKLTKQRGGYSAPTWSPNNDYIAFTKHFGGEFYIGVIRPDGTGERLLTKGYLVEGPQWSPNGKRIVFCRQERAKKNRPNPSKICTIEVTGHNETTLKSIPQGSDPTWSNILPT